MTIKIEILNKNIIFIIHKIFFKIFKVLGSYNISLGIIVRAIFNSLN